MSDLHKNPQTEPQDEHVEIRYTDRADWDGTKMNIAGPGGKTTNLEHNERGILQQGLFDAMSFHQEASLESSKHDPHAQGIYRTDGRYAD